MDAHVAAAAAGFDVGGVAMRTLLGVVLHVVARSAGRLGRTHDRTHDCGATAAEYLYQGFADAIGLS